MSNLSHPHETSRTGLFEGKMGGKSPGLSPTQQLLLLLI
jgi:hypothetical protein